MPVVVALNMIDVAEAQGIKIDCRSLSEQLGVPVVPIQANKGIGLTTLTQAVLAAAESAKAPARAGCSPRRSRRRSRRCRRELGDEVPGFLVRRLLLDVGGYAEQWLVGQRGDGLKLKLAAARQRLAEAGCAVPAVEARTRFGWVRGSRRRGRRPSPRRARSRGPTGSTAC